MLKDASKLKKIQSHWTAGVEELKGRLCASVTMGMMGTFPWVANDAYDCALNVPFLNAIAALNDALVAMSEENVFKCKSEFLGTLVIAAKQLTWVDYAAVLEAIDKRNDLAHRGVLLTREESDKYTEVIKSELRAWSIIV